jgi:DnaJ-domain-containing protein 1
MPALILGLALLVGLFLLARWYVQADPKQLVRLIRWTAAIVGVLFVVFIALSGRWGWLPGLVIAALPWLLRARAVRTFARNARGPSPGQSSQVETRFLSMVLNHDTGEMEGEILEGRFAGRRLSDLAPDDLVELWRECAAADEQSMAVLATYMDRVYGSEWREAAAGGHDGQRRRPGGGGAMTVDEAYEVLGVEPGASPEEIERAYRRMMLKMHPDQGGSDYLAAKINEAKELLLRR